ncbi:MAG: hypothetical protein EOP06_27550, partial [Proteobacteria bacterium]
MPNPTPNAMPPGSLADHVLGAKTFQQIRRAKNIEIVTGVGAKENSTAVPVEETSGLIERLVQMLHEDMLYTAEPTSLFGEGDMEIRLLYPLPDVRIALFLKRHRIRLSYLRNNTGHSKELLLDPIGKPLLELIQQNAPTDERVKRLEFTPLSPPSPKTPSGIPPDILRAIRSVRPGMRRADVLK